VIASDASVSAGEGEFAYFEFALVGAPLVLGCIAIVVLFGERLLPMRTARSITANFSAHARTLVRQYGLDLDDPLFTEEYGAAEVVIPPRSALIGEHVFPGMVTESGDLVIMAIQRAGEDLGDKGDELREGDTVLLRGKWAALDLNLQADPDVLLVDLPDQIRRQAAPLGRKAWFAIAVLAGMIVLLFADIVPAAIAAVLAAGALVLSGVLSIKQALRSVSWTTVILVGGMIPLSTAMIQTGAADDISNLLVDAVGDSGEYPLLIGLFLITVTFGQLISNTATALIVTPIALAAAIELDVNAQPLLMTVTVASAAAFLTPVATPANLMVMEPGGYKFNDYWKLGLPMLVWFFIVSIALIPLFWGF
jgi:di/tricarboxylate transporter